MTVSHKRSFALALAGGFIAYAAITVLYLQPGPGTPHQPGSAPVTLLAVADLTQFLLMLVCVGLCAWQATRFHGRGRAFWALMTAGFAAWSTSQFAWVYFDLVLRRPLPDPFWTDIVLFFHFVPFTAALVVRPHRPGELRRIVLPAIDWTMLLLWWMYLYVFLVFPWQFIQVNVDKYDANFGRLYVAGNLLWLCILLGFVLSTRKGWRTTYLFLLGSGGLYAAASQLIEWATRNGYYYSGSAYDLPLVAAMLLFVWTVAQPTPEEPRPEAGDRLNAHQAESLGPRLAMGALLSIPVIVGWMEFDTEIHGGIYRFRLVASMLAIVAMGALVFLKHFLLDQERVRLLEESRRNFANLQNLQAQLIRQEKLASLAQLVSGAAHEINNPLTAILGYAELMEYDGNSDETLKSHAAKIKQQVLRTKDLVKNLQKFAKQPAAGEKQLVDLNLVVENSIQARESEPANKAIRFERQFNLKLKPVLGDERQLSDVCMQLLGNASSVMAKQGGGTVTAKTLQESGWAILEISDTGPGMSDPARVFDPFFTTKTIGQGTGLGLSVCYGIIADHKGFIFAENLPDGGARLTVRLPIAGQSQSNPGLALSQKQQ